MVLAKCFCVGGMVGATIMVDRFWCGSFIILPLALCPTPQAGPGLLCYSSPTREGFKPFAKSTSLAAVRPATSYPPILTAAVLTAEEGETLGRVTGHMLYCRRHLGGCWLCTGLLGHLSALQWEASSPAGARPLLWMWQQPAEPGSTTGSCSATSPPPSLPWVWALLHHVRTAPCQLPQSLWYLKWSEQQRCMNLLSTYMWKTLLYERNLW